MPKPNYTDYNGNSSAYYEACIEYAIMGDRTGNEDDDYCTDEEEGEE